MNNLTPRIVMLGPPGSGKGTQGLILAHRLLIPHVSTGELLRQAKQADTALGRQIRSALDAGKLVSDEEIEALLFARLDEFDCQAGWILDGYPRRVSQAATLDRYSPPTLAIAFDLPDQVAVDRLGHRYVCPHGHIYNDKFIGRPLDDCCIHCYLPLARRPEDTSLEVIHERLRLYRTVTEPIKEYYGPQGKLLLVKADPPISAVTKFILARLTTGPWLSPTSWARK